MDPKDSCYIHSSPVLQIPPSRRWFLFSSYGQYPVCVCYQLGKWRSISFLDLCFILFLPVLFTRLRSLLLWTDKKEFMT